MVDAIGTLEVGEVGIRESQTDLQKEAPPPSEKEVPVSGFDGFLATLSFPTPTEQGLLKKRIEQAKIEWSKWYDTPRDKRGLKNPPSLRDIFEGRDPETRDLTTKEANTVLKELGPQVVKNIRKILDEIPDIDGAGGTEEFFKKRSADLKTLLSFDFMSQNRPMNVQEERLLRYALSVIYYMTDMHVAGEQTEGGLYEIGLDRLTQRLRKNPAYTHSEEAKRPGVVKQLGKQAAMVHHAIELSFGFGEKALPRRGLIDGVWEKDETLTFFARRVDPKFYLDLEDRMLGLDPSQTKVEAPPPQPARMS